MEVITIRIRFFFSAAAAAILLSGCAAVSAPPAPTLPPSLSCTVSTPSGTCQCSVRHVADTLDSVTFTAPESLAGLCFRRTDEGSSLELGSLLCRSDRIRLPEDAAPSCVLAAVESLSRTEPDDMEETDDGYRITGSVSCATFTARTDKDGTITSLELQTHEPD